MMIVTTTQMHDYLEGAEFPLSKRNIMQIAHTNGAPEYVLSMLEEIQDMDYQTLAELMEEISVVEPQFGYGV